MTTGSSRHRTLVGLKDAAITSLYLSGILWVVALGRFRRRTVVLTYHRVLPEDRQADSFSAPGILVTPESFERQMRFLRRFFRPLTLDQFVAALGSGHPMPRWSCLVTFDDGWYDTLEFALPILRRHTIPAVLFVAADYVGTGRCFWQERISRLLFGLRNCPKALRLVASLGPLTTPAAEHLASRESIRKIVTELKSSPPAEIVSLLEKLEQLAAMGPDCGEDRFLDWDEVAELASSGLVTIGSHATSHRPLTQMPLADARRELQESRAVLHSRLGTEVTALAYPNGDATQEIAAVAEVLGFAAAFTTARGHVAAGTDPYLLRRVNIHEGSTRTRSGFFARLLGLI